MKIEKYKFTLCFNSLCKSRAIMLTRPTDNLHIQEQNMGPDLALSYSIIGLKSHHFSFSEKFNPALYRPVIVPPRPRIMQDFIANGGKVTAFTQPDNTVIQLRKPQVHKSVPKVSPPVGTVRQSTGSVLDKIQAELAETKKREDELRKARRDMFRCEE